MEEERKLNFLEEIIENDLKSGKVDSILTRFPPEPNGYLHLGHAKSLCINFGLAQKYGGKTNLRYDDTNPTKEDTEYVDAIKEDIKWLGFQWEKELYASDYFDQLYEWAEQLIQRGLAYVDDQTQEEISAGRGTVETPGKESPWRNRTPEENLRIFREMRDGKYADGEKVLRAKIDMAHPNMMFRDPILYRIKHAHHHRTGDKWCIYPMYDYTHGQCDSIEHITHSICTLEFDVHRPLYDWFIETLGIFPSHQYEFARLNLTYTLMSKRKLLELVQKGLVAGWDDPRMPTLCGVRRRIDDPDLRTRAARFLKARLRAGHAHQIAESTDRTSVFKRQHQSLVNIAYRRHADRTSGSRDQPDIRRQDFAYAQTKDLMSVRAAHFHDLHFRAAVILQDFERALFLLSACPVCVLNHKYSSRRSCVSA